MARFLQSQVDWSILEGCFPGTIKPSDLDGWVEIGGRVLFLEHKQPGAELWPATRIAFRALAQQGNTVIVFWSDGPAHEAIPEIKVYGPSGFQTFKGKDLEFLRGLVRGWV